MVQNEVLFQSECWIRHPVESRSGRKSIPPKSGDADSIRNSSRAPSWIVRPCLGCFPTLCWILSESLIPNLLTGFRRLARICLGFFDGQILSFRLLLSHSLVFLLESSRQRFLKTLWTLGGDQDLHPSGSIPVIVTPQRSPRRLKQCVRILWSSGSEQEDS